MHISIPDNDHSGSMAGIDLEKFTLWDFGPRGAGKTGHTCTFCDAGHKPTERHYGKAIRMNSDIHIMMFSSPKDFIDCLMAVREIHSKKNRSHRLAKKLAKRFIESYNARHN